MEKGQIWIETAVYTLIGLALIGMILGFAMPKIKQAQEKIIVEQSIEALSKFDSLVREVALQGAGNRRQYELMFKKGKFLESFTKKGRFNKLLSKIRVQVILNSHTALLGAANYVKHKDVI